jgi:isopentenyl diphosphate isomerase/L-lactate dehydrogenase-like FMN-dependent dehydrogenase
MNDAENKGAATVGGEAGASEFENLHEIISKARQNLSQNAWDYIIGGTETETTLKRNRLALDSVAFRPRVLRDVSRVDASVDRLGRRLRLPLLLAPAGPLEIFERGGGATVAEAAETFGVAQMLSSGCAPGLEAVAAAAPDALRMAQLYVRGDDAFVRDYVARAIACGCAAFCLTVDSAVPSRRERDLAKRHRMVGRRRIPVQGSPHSTGAQSS